MLAFLEKSKNVHKGRYDYSLVEYKTCHDKVKIICKKHGVFEQKPYKHTNRGDGCPKCSGNYVRSLDDFLREAKEVHGNKFDYSLVELKSYSVDKITIICKDHGPFLQLPRNHINQKHGCPVCGGHRNITTDIFVSEATTLHNGKYDYSSCTYTGMHGYVIIKCPNHGNFKQKALSHMQGQGCKKCHQVTIDTSNFIVQASKIHNNIYNYDNVEYKNSKTKVNIICELHGVFHISAYRHLQGDGCQQCSILKRAKNASKPLHKLIEEFVGIHANKYDYSNVHTDYKNSESKINIICNGCKNSFKVSVKNHLGRESGCPKCSGCYRRTTDDFISEAQNVHGNRYDYSKSIFTKTDNTITVICKNHGEFNPVAKVHLHGFGCPKCSMPNYGMNQDMFILKSNTLYNHKYNYNEVKYNGILSKVKITCKEHGLTFFQKACSHLYGFSGCIKCNAPKRYSKMQIQWLEYLSIKEGCHFEHAENTGEVCLDEIGYVDGFNKDKNIVAEFHGDFWHGNPLIYNIDAINIKNKKTFGELYQHTLNRQNTIKQKGYKLIVMWESDWKKLIKCVKFIQKKWRSRKISITL